MRVYNVQVPALCAPDFNDSFVGSLNGIPWLVKSEFMSFDMILELLHERFIPATWYSTRDSNTTDYASPWSPLSPERRTEE